MLYCTEIEQLSHLFHIFLQRGKNSITWHIKTCDIQLSVSLRLCATFSYAFFSPADICLTLEAVILVGSVKEYSLALICCSWALWQKKKMPFRSRIGIFKVPSNTTALVFRSEHSQAKFANEFPTKHLDGSGVKETRFPVHRKTVFIDVAGSYKN